MNMKISAIAAAVAFTISGSATASVIPDSYSELPPVPSTFDEQEETYNYTAGAVHQYNATAEFNDKVVSWTGSETLNPKGDKNSNTFLLLNGGTGNSTLTNNSTIWVFNKYRTYSVQAITVSGGAGTVINNGKIYLDGTGSSIDKITGIGIDGTNNQNEDKAINNGLIIAKHAHGIRIAKSSYNDAVENGKNGTIVALDGGKAISTGGTGSGHEINNVGSIYADETSYGIYVTGATESTINNSGKILADKNAITVYSQNNTVNLSTGSEIEGKIQLTKTTKLNIDGVNDDLDLYTTGQLGDSSINDSTIILSDASYTGTSGIKFGNLSVDNSTVEAASGTKISIENLSGESADFVINDIVDSTEDAQVQIASAEKNTKVNSYFKVGDEVAGGKYSVQDVIDSSAQVQNNATDANHGDITIYGTHLAGTDVLKWNDSLDSYTLASHTDNGFTVANMDLAKLNGIAWRNELTSLTDRMSTLRTAPEFAGVWARYKGGEWDGDSINQQFNGVEVGVDKAFSQNFVLGLAASYIEGDGDLDNGSADTENYSGAAYLSYYNSGWFVDVMGKLGKIETDFDLTYNGLKDSGDYTMSGYVFGVETGYRFNFNNFYVEPQVQLTYSYLGSKEFTTDNRTVDFETLESLVGRVGFMSGYDFGDIGSAYLRASYYHDFDGDVDMSVSHNDLTVYESDELDSDWGDVGVGANVNFGGATLFFDVSRTYGGDIDMEWKANAGARYSF